MIIFQLISKWLSVDELINLESTCKNFRYDNTFWRYHFFGQNNFKRFKYKLLSNKSIRESLIYHHQWKQFTSLPILHIIEYLYEVKKIRDFLTACYVFNSNIIMELYKMLNKTNIYDMPHLQRVQINRWKFNIYFFLKRPRFKKKWKKERGFKRVFNYKKINVIENQMFNQNIECLS